MGIELLPPGVAEESIGLRPLKRVGVGGREEAEEPLKMAQKNTRHTYNMKQGLDVVGHFVFCLKILFTSDFLT